MIYLHKDKIEKYTSAQRINLLLIIDITFSLILFLYLNYFIGDLSIQTYILTESSFNYIIVALIINQVACLIFNLKMNYFVQKHQRMDLLAIPLLE